MYVIRRVYETKLRTAKLVASMVKRQGDIYHESGHRSEVTVYFNDNTVPGDADRVYMEWTDHKIQSPYREGNDIPSEALELGGKVREHVIRQYIEFFEMMTPDKMVK